MSKISEQTLKHIRQLKDSCVTERDGFYDRAEQLLKSDRTTSSINNTNGNMNAHMTLVYRALEELIMSVNGLYDKPATEKQVKKPMSEVGGKSTTEQLGITRKAFEEFQTREKRAREVYGLCRPYQTSRISRASTGVKN